MFLQGSSGSTAGSWWWSSFPNSSPPKSYVCCTSQALFLVSLVVLISFVFPCCCFGYFLPTNHLFLLSLLFLGYPLIYLLFIIYLLVLFVSGRCWGMIVFKGFGNNFARIFIYFNHIYSISSTIDIWLHHWLLFLF